MCKQIAAMRIIEDCSDNITLIGREVSRWFMCSIKFSRSNDRNQMR